MDYKNKMTSKNMETYQEQLAQWAEQTAELYHKLAISDAAYNLGFYTQSDLRKVGQHPELMILAINPGSNGLYYGDAEAMINKQYWKEWGVSDRMSGAVLMKGNPDFSNKKNWSFWKRLRSILNHGGIDSLLDDEHQFVYANVILFNTPKANKIPPKAFELVPQTIELIQIIQPKRILCLGKNDCFNKLQPYITKTTELIPGKISKGLLLSNQIPIYGIPHTSTRYSNEEMDMIGSCLGYLFEHEEDEIMPKHIQKRFDDKIQRWKNRKRNAGCDYEQLTTQLKKLLGNPYFDQGRTLRFHFCGKLALTFSMAENGYLGIRAKDESKQTEDWNGALDEEQKYIDILSTYGWQSDKIWVGKKSIRKYHASDEIIQEIHKIKSTIDS